MTTETIYEKEITFPYCEYEFEESYDYGLEHDGDCDDLECPECQKIFRVTMDITVTYSTIALCRKNKENHQWKEFDYSGRKGRMCDVCDECEFYEPTGVKPRLVAGSDSDNSDSGSKSPELIRKDGVSSGTGRVTEIKGGSR